MDQLKERILKEGKHIGNGILKVDGFINHQVDPVLMNEAGKEFARLFKHVSPTKILTAEISGIAPAVSTGLQGQGERVLIIDDFLATGLTILGLIRLAETAGSTIVGVGALIEKTFESGRERLEKINIPVHSLARIKSMEGDTITLY
jgi:xanthine phosphoribosyltransferase